MLTRHNTNTDPRIEAIPLNLVASEDGRTLLTVTERKDGTLEIVATPITLIGQTGTTSLAAPILQISLEDIVNESELQSATQTLDIEPEAVIEPMKLQSCIEIKYSNIGTHESQSLLQSPLLAIDSEKDDGNYKPNEPIVKKNNAGRPKKNPDVPLKGPDSLKCDICQQEFVKQSLYRKHMENHAEEKPYRCPKCSASFNVPSNFTLHMATHNTSEPKCPECGKKFTRMASLKSHMLLHEKEENLFCTECEDAFSTKAQLDAHLKLHGEKWTVEEVRKCKLCSKQFSQPALYRLHIREHYRLKTKIVKQTKRGTKQKMMYKCTICLKSFQKPSQLMRHIRVHTGEKPFKCTVCDRAFTQKSSLQIHTWQHNGIRPHTCELCNAKFSQKGNLNAHVMRVHNVPEGESIYACNYCSCVFKKLGSLNGHVKRMHNDANEEVNGSPDDDPDIRATVDTVITQLESLKQATNQTSKMSDPETTALSETIAKKDILQQALKNSGLPSKNKATAEGTAETKKCESRTSFVTLLDRSPDGGARNYLTIKQRCVGNVRWYSCTFCHKEFKKPSDLLRHLRVHTQEKPFKCTHCYRSFALKSTMIAHERTHSNIKKYACGFCDKTFVCHSSLVAHAKSHKESDKSADKDAEVQNGTPAYTVNQSKAQAKGKSRLPLEAENLSEVILQEPLVISDTGNKICVAQVPSKEKRSCDGNTDPGRPHTCWICQAAFRKISHLKQHHRRHTGERPYKCTKCDRRFTSNSVLKSHLHTHEDSRPYSCTICSARFSTQSSMKRHLVTHSNKRPYMCPYCHKTFKTYVNCRKHMKIHKYELAQQQRQLEQERIQVQEQDSIETSLESRSKQEAVVESSSTSIASIDPTIAITTTAVSTPTIIATSSSTFPTLSRLGPVELSFQPQLGPEFSQTFPEFRAVTEDKENGRPVLSSNCDGTTFINETASDIAVMNIENSQMLHTDETGSVTLPVYSGDRAFTPESIRDIEETLNQQLFNIGMNLNLGNHNSKLVNASDVICQTKEQQEPAVLNVIYENDSTNRNGEPSGHVFSSQLDSFDMDHIGLQSDAHEIDIALNATNPNDVTSMLTRSSKQEHQLSVCVAASDNANDDREERSGMQAVVLISQENFGPESAAAELATKQTQKTDQQCTIDPIFLTNELREPTQEFKIRSSNVQEMVKTVTGKISRGESLLQCHICGQQGFTTMRLKEHLMSHRYGGTKEYQCTECSSKFLANAGSHRHLKTRTDKQSFKCPACEKRFDKRTETRSQGESRTTWSGISSGTNCGTMGAITDNRTALDNIVIDSDSAVSEKVLLDTVAEKEVMDCVETILMEKEERKEYTNKCKYCPKTFRKPSDLIRHVRTHTGERPYKCDYCSKSFAVKCTLDSHTKVHTGKKTFRCHVCNSLFATKGSLKVHMRLHTGSKPFRCPFCDSRFRTSGHRKVHLLKHTREHKDNPKRKPKHMKVAAVAQVAADLEKCNSEVERKENEEANRLETKHQLLQITETATGIGPDFGTFNIEATAPCLTDQINLDADGIVSSNDQTIVSIGESNQLVTNLHFLLTDGLVAIHTEESLPPQSIGNRCEALNPNTESTNEKMNAEHTEEALEIPDISNNCLLSEAMANTQLEPISKAPGKKEARPERSGTKGNSNSKKECDICGKVFTKPYQVERHKRIHTGERPYKCDLCTKSFAQKSTLQMHQKHHTGDRPYACPYCEYSFTQKGNLRTHVKRVHQLDTVDLRKWKRTQQSKPIVEEDAIEVKSLNLDDISFVEFLK
ncbi:zinc finger protein 236-like isoform X2 [Ceratina calcarata]|uniref:Zinc finger protein 236-like isoform X1 n=1 Tax=Ceratina calcarata TaxID=156304 RepID=A0AAJ7S0U3_9HYME|nr:zinc finger protein 236-like isoform X1 [Ceratina calcarata]XP_026669266.1 zinc finger protein 236-like isoform X2 [Ceratina calcarata]